MTKGKPRDKQREQQWRRWIQRCQASGLTVRAFCARHGLAQPNFYAWRRELERRDAESPAFVPVRVCVCECVWSERCKSSSGTHSPACN